MIIGKLKQSIEDHTPFGNKIGRVYGYFLLAKFYLNPASIKSVHLQFVNYCNLNCEYCSFSNKQNKETISEELLSKFFEEILFSGRFKVKEVNLWVAGENLLHPDFFGILDLMKSYKLKSRNFPKIKLFTNGTLLNKSMSKKIIDSGVIDWVGFSIDGGSREECERIRKGSKFDIIKRNLKDFQDMNKHRIETMINCLVPAEKPLDSVWMAKEFKEMLDLVDYYKLNYPMHVGIDVSYPKGFRHYKWDKKICPALLNGIAIIQNGDVLPCCSDFNGIQVIGNMNKQSLAEICKGKKRKEMVAQLLKGNKDKILLCKECNRFSVPYKIFKKK